MRNVIPGVIGIWLMLSRIVLASDIACSSFCAFNTPKGGCSYIQITSDAEIGWQAWGNLVTRCGEMGAGILVLSSPSATPICEEQKALVAATPWNSCAN